MILLCFILILLLILALTALSLILHDLKIMNEQMAYKKKANAGFDVCVHSSSKTVVSLQKKINELYEQLAEAEINKLKKEQNMQKLLTNVSHDIRTPLTSISYMRKFPMMTFPAARNPLPYIRFYARLLPPIIMTSNKKTLCPKSRLRIRILPYPLTGNYSAAFFII